MIKALRASARLPYKIKGWPAGADRRTSSGSMQATLSAQSSTLPTAS